MASTTARLGIWLSVAAIVLGALLVLAVAPLRDGVLTAVRGDTDGVRDQLREAGITGVAILLALILVHAVVFYPAEIVNTAAGYVYGFGVALPLVMAGWIVSGLAAYSLGRAAGRPLGRRLVGARRFEEAERLIHRGGAPILLAARLVPIVPFSLVGYVAGAMRVPVGRYGWTTAVGSLPLTAAVVLLGHRLDDLSPSDPLLSGALLVFLALLLAVRPLRRRLRAEPPPPPTRSDA